MVADTDQEHGGALCGGGHHPWLLPALYHLRDPAAGGQQGPLQAMLLIPGKI